MMVAAKALRWKSILSTQGTEVRPLWLAHIPQKDNRAKLESWLGIFGGGGGSWGHSKKIMLRPNWWESTRRLKTWLNLPLCKKAGCVRGRPKGEESRSGAATWQTWTLLWVGENGSLPPRWGSEFWVPRRYSCALLLTSEMPPEILQIPVIPYKEILILPQALSD